jgi:hypothetical protein
MKRFIFAAARLCTVMAFAPSLWPNLRPFLASTTITSRGAVNAAEDSTTTNTPTYQPLFDFALNETLDKIDRLDDVIMGGISSSQVVRGDGYAKWVGVCRTEGGGFCGFRTNPFTKPLMVQDADGFYLTVRLASDQDSDRRVWKLTTRAKPDRGEVLYQAPFSFQQKHNEWSTIRVPFDSFALVSGPRMVNGPPLNTTGGLFQIGMTLSKFVFGGALKELDNFRDGYFELQIKEIGLYNDIKFDGKIDVSIIGVLSKEEAKTKRPIALKLLLPISKLLFSEQR